ncbi:MAG: Clp protease N-terminal domain-containing protein [Chloroflexota bacterium]|nr:Clp protease N-terminal domain-containing protein [Chloroflexota bacterium]
MRTVSRLLQGAERIARASGEEQPGAEHLLLAAMDLPDGTARRAFERAGANPDGLAAAIAAQHADALRSVGIDAGEVGDLEVPAPEARSVFRSTPSAQAVFRRAVDLSANPRPRRLLGAHIVVAVAEMERGTASRALAHLGVDRGKLAGAAREELSLVTA